MITSYCISVFVHGCLAAAFAAFFYLHAKKAFYTAESMKVRQKLSKKKEVETSIILNQTKCPNLSCCTPLDRVIFHVCALLEIWWNVALQGRGPPGNLNRLLI